MNDEDDYKSELKIKTNIQKQSLKDGEVKNN